MSLTTSATTGGQRKWRNLKFSMDTPKKMDIKRNKIWHKTMHQIMIRN